MTRWTGTWLVFLRQLPAWLPLPLLATVLLALLAADPRWSYDSPRLALGLFFVFSVLASLFVAWLVGRSFLARGSPGLLLLGCGVVVWGTSPFVALGASLLASAGQQSANIGVTIHSSTQLLSAWLQFVGVVLSLGPARAVRKTGAWLAATYAASLAAVGLIVWVTLAGWTPTFFVQGHGGTPVRQSVLAFAVLVFAATAIVMGAISRKSPFRFPYWYSLALGLLTLGLASVLMAPTTGCPLFWMGRTAQYLAGVYMAVAAMAAWRETRPGSGQLHLALHQEPAFVAAVLETVGALVAVLDREGRIVSFNRACEQATGYTFEEVTGRPVWDFLLTDEQVAPVKALVAELSRGQFPSHYENQWVAKDGARLLIHWSNSCLTGPSGEVEFLIGTGLDVTVRQKAAERAALLSEVASQLLAGERPQQLVESLCRRVMEHLGCHVFFNFLVDPQVGRLHLNACAGIPPEAVPNLEWLDFGAAICGCVARDGSRIVAENVQTTADSRAELVRACGVQAYACHPLLNQGQVIGTLSFGSRTKTRFAEDDLALMKCVSDQVAVAMQRLRLLQSLEASAGAAAAASVAKSQFLASMSHELRTPMNAILGMTDLALGEELTPTLRDYLQTSKDSADLLLELLDEILDFSRIEAGRFELESTPFDLRQTVEQAVKTLGVRAYEKGLELFSETAADLPDLVVGDPLRLRQVLLNLLGNAIKFTSKGEVVVRAEVKQRTAKTVTLGLSVSDTGIGIPPEKMASLFTPFTQADSSTTRRFGGTGLGLAISQRLAGLMGGEIRAQSQQDKGSTFCFSLTLPIGERARTAQVAPGVGLGALRDLPVLVIAESATGRRMLQQMLAAWSMRVDEAPDAPGGLVKVYAAAAARRPYRVVLADAVMAGVDGFTLADWLAQDPRLAGPVILVLSSSERQDNRDRCQRLKTPVVEKPVSRQALLGALTQVLGDSTRAGPAGAGDPGLPQPSASRQGAGGQPAPPTAKRPLRVLLAEDAPANQKLVKYILVGRGHSVEIVGNGQLALQALGTQDYDVVLMDVQMPEMDGLQTTAAIRKLDDAKKASLPIVAMTAHSLKGDADRCLAAGMTTYLSKPIKVKELIEVVERLADGNRTHG